MLNPSIIHMVIWVFYCRSFYTPLRRAGHSKTGRIMLAGTRLPAADDIFIWLLDTLLRMCCILPFKKLQPESPNQPCSRGRRYMSHPASQPLVGTTQNYPSDPSKPSDCGGHPGSTKHLAICSIRGGNHNGHDSSSTTDHRHQVALSAEKGVP